MQKNSTLDTSIGYLKGVGPKRAELLQKELGIFTFDDLLHHFPYRYIDRTKFYKINEVHPDQPYIQVKGVLNNISMIGQGRSRRLVARLSDETGSIELVWFQGIKWVEKILHQNEAYVVFGKPNLFNRKINIAHPEIELLKNYNPEFSNTLQGLYHATEKLKSRGLDSKGLLKLIKTLFTTISSEEIPEVFSEDIIAKYRFKSRSEVYYNIHFPKNEQELLFAQKQLKFEELFFIQLKLLKLRDERKHQVPGYVLKNIEGYFNTFYENHLPFNLTNAQKRVLKEIRRDLLSGKQMNRLLQGDVGSGKTIVSLMCMLMALDNDLQCSMMAPTEILANQHYKGITELTYSLGLKVELLTGSIKGKKRKEILERLALGDIHILIGTHALIEGDVKFKKAGLVIIDEQHRFGVAQRAKLLKKGWPPPHVLIMTATPIPRTLALTLYGDLDVSVIDELPPGRKPITTVHKKDANRLRVFGFMKEQIQKGRQIYVVYPLIEESETLDYKDLMDGYESITRTFPLPEYKVSIVHGRMKSDDKDTEMQLFAEGKTQIMVATTVIEVGVNVPNASVMVIESAERFGLSQLHQLRGRVGRGAEQSFCILMTGYKLSKEARTRIETMVETNDGFKIAEVDLQLRGPGDIEGTQQSGMVPLKIANLATDGRILNEARVAAEELLDKDPALELPGNQKIKKHFTSKKMNRVNWGRVG